MGNKLINNGIKPIYFYPKLLSCDEIFLPITEKSVPKIAPYYIVSNYGRVYNYYNNRFLIPFPVKNHLYVNIQIFQDNNISKERKIPVHRLMMMEFNYIDGCENLDVDHVDGVSYNNYLSNLEWCTREENMRRAHALGIMNNRHCGINNYNATLNESQVKKICELLCTNRYTLSEIANIVGTTKDIVFSIKRRKSWKHISQYYDW